MIFLERYVALVAAEEEGALALDTRLREHGLRHAEWADANRHWRLRLGSEVLRRNLDLPERYVALLTQARGADATRRGKPPSPDADRAPEAQRLALPLDVFARVTAALELGLPRTLVLDALGVAAAAFRSAEHAWIERFGRSVVRGDLSLAERWIAIFRREQEGARGEGLRQRLQLPGRLVELARLVSTHTGARTPPSLSQLIGDAARGGTVEEAPRGAGLGIVEFAAFCAERAVAPDRASVVGAHFGLDDLREREVRAAWDRIFAEEPRRFEEYLALFRGFRDWFALAGQDGGRCAQ
jgi:hypothetical protein